MLHIEGVLGRIQSNIVTGSKMIRKGVPGFRTFEIYSFLMFIETVFFVFMT